MPKLFSELVRTTFPVPAFRVVKPLTSRGPLWVMSPLAKEVFTVRSPLAMPPPRMMSLLPPRDTLLPLNVTVPVNTFRGLLRTMSPRL